MTEVLQFHALVQGILRTSNAAKQELGRRFALHLGLTPGPGGPDDGVDGHGVWMGKRLHFQCRLKSEELDRNEARSFYSDLKYHKASVGIMLSGLGYKDTFCQRLYGHDDIGEFTIHLLTLQDLFEKNEQFLQAASDLPAIVDLGQVAVETHLRNGRSAVR